MSLSPVASNTRFHPNFAAQQPNGVWTYGPGQTNSRGATAVGTLPQFLIKGRYGEPILTRIYNNLPVDRSQNNGFGRNESQLHFHNAHNGAESDGAANVHHFPGTFYDHRWSTTARREDQYLSDGSSCVRTKRQWRPFQCGGRFPRASRHDVGP